MKRALVVGINCYLKLGKLRTPANDANAVAKRLQEIGFDEIRGLPSASPDSGLWVDPDPERKVSNQDLEQAIEWLFAIEDSSKIPETALFFFAGHGLRYVRGCRSKGFLATSSANPENASTDKWGLSLVDLRQILEQAKAVKQQIVILDCCHAGEIFNYKEASEIDPKNSEIVTRCLMSACAPSQLAFEPTEGQGEHSYFTATLLEGLQQPGRITTITLSKYVKEHFRYKLQNVGRNNSRNQDCYQDPDCRNRDGEIILLDPEAESLPPTDIIEQGFNPYKGLEAFQEADAPYFFGRGKLTKTLVSLIHDKPFLAVSGSSGSGKSSVVRAGLIPDLKQGSTFSETTTWKIYEPFQPGDDPLASLAQVLADENLPLEEVKAKLAQGATGLQSLISQTKRPCVLVVDQFEQLFTQCKSEDKRRQFLDCLCGDGQGNALSLRVVITIRDDFLGKCAEYPQLLKLINTNKEIVGPMDRAELREAISQPIQKVGWKIPSDLETLMLEDLQKSPGSLPLLQYLLQQMVDRLYKFGQGLTVQTYQDMGGVQTALQKQANQVYQSLTPEQQTIARNIFLELTQLTPQGENTTATARQVRKSQLTSLPPAPEQVEAVLEKLEAARLIVTRKLPAPGDKADQITVVDVAHESLIGNWEQLKQWVNENPEAKRQRDEIEKKTQDWEDKGKRREKLLRGLDLMEVKAFAQRHQETLPLSPLAQEYLRTSTREHRAIRIIGISAAFVGFTVVTGLWLNAQRQATIANLRAKAAQAENLLTSADPVEGLVLAIQATGESQDELGQVISSVQSSLLTSIQTPLEQNRLSHQDSVLAVAFSPDGQTIVSGGDDNTLRLWNRQGEPIGEPFRGHQGWVWAVAFSPDGQTIVSGSGDGTLRLWKVGNWQNWLQIACRQLQYHPVLVASETDVARQAGKTCQKYAWTPAESAKFLVRQGNALARNGDFSGAVAQFKRALKLDNTLDLNPEAKAKQIAAAAMVEKAEQFTRKRNYKAAVEAYTSAQKIDPTVEISAQTWGSLCWYGSLRGEAAAVMPACQQAVTLRPKDAGYRASLGIAKAMTGDKEGAIKDFQAFIDLSNDEGSKEIAQGYIDALSAGENPFTEAEIKRLLGE